jgi:hypothetical protein
MPYSSTAPHKFTTGIWQAPRAQTGLVAGFATIGQITVVKTQRRYHSFCAAENQIQLLVFCGFRTLA